MPHDVTTSLETGHNDTQRFIVGSRTVRICPDESPESPREWSNLGTMLCWHRRYNLGDKHAFADPRTFQHWLKNNPAIVLPLYLYDHGGITMNTTGFHCPWDSGQVGYIYVTLADVRKEYAKRCVSQNLRRQVEEYLRQEVATYDEFLTGNVYGFIIEDEGGKTLDSCWGFIGLDACVEEASIAARQH